MAAAGEVWCGGLGVADSDRRVWFFWQVSLEQTTQEEITQRMCVASESLPTTYPRRTWVPSHTELAGEHAAGYSWRENELEMEVAFPLPVGTSKGELTCEITTSGVSLCIAQCPTLLDGALAGRVVPDGSAWSFEPARSPIDHASVLINFAKRERKLWGYVMLSDRLRADEGESGEDSGCIS